MFSYLKTISIFIPSVICYKRFYRANCQKIIQYDKKKAQQRWALNKGAGIALLSHTLTRAIPSPQESLTSEFGMGSGVSSLL